MNIAAFYPNYFHISGIAYVALSVIEAMQTESTKLTLMGIASGTDLSEPFYRNALPSWSKSMAYNLLTDAQIKRIAEFRFIKSINTSDIAYLWPATSLSLYQNLYARKHKIIIESVNTHQATSKAILDAEYAKLGLQTDHGITIEDGIIESSKLALADFIFSCSPAVTNSLLDVNTPRSKILETSYGLRKSDILLPQEMIGRSSDNEITAIFVGTIGVRKGPHLILEYWCKSNVKGKLRLIGHIEPEVRHLIEPYLKRSDIEHVPYTNDLKSIYKEADIFLLPSLEEGSPLVTYLALGAGLPCIVSPMGSGGIIDQGKEGYVINPENSQEWIESLKMASEDVSLRKELSKNSYMKAKDYLWSVVGHKRTQILLSRFHEQLH
jgi:glycosyltransferase involved in cell wall biosynthesis